MRPRRSRSPCTRVTGSRSRTSAGERRDIIPAHLRTWKGIRSTAYRYFDAARFHTLFHALRSPQYLAMSAWWAIVGLVRLGRRQLAWWWVTEQGYLRSKAVVDGNSPEWRALHSHVIKRRSFRGACLAAELFAVVLVLVLVAAFAPWWSWFVVAAAAGPPLAAYGHPDSMTIFKSAVMTPLVRKVSTDAIVRAYERAGLCSTDPKKPADHLGFGSVMSRDALDKGSQVVIYLPYGGTFDAVVNAKTKIASGLDVSESQVYFTRDKQSERRHTLRVLDADPLAEPAGRTPLLDCKQRSVWRKFPFGLDQFGRKVAFCLLWISLLIGAQPRRGKTFGGRLIALYCALDPYVNITLIDGKSSRDWLPLKYVAHRFVQGTHPTKDGNPVEQALEALYEIERHIVHVNDELKLLPNKTLYVRDDDLPLWERAQNYAAERNRSVSAVVTEALKTFLPAEIKAGDMSEIRVETGEEPTITRAFIGRWLVEPDADGTRTVVDGYDAGTYWGIALTRRGKIAVYSAHCNDRRAARLDVHDDLDEAENDGTPPDLISMAATALGQERVLKMDI
jgi:hypothetical protein